MFPEAQQWPFDPNQKGAQWWGEEQDYRGRGNDIKKMRTAKALRVAAHDPDGRTSEGFVKLWWVPAEFVKQYKAAAKSGELGKYPEPIAMFLTGHMGYRVPPVWTSKRGRIIAVGGPVDGRNPHQSNPSAKVQFKKAETNEWYVDAPGHPGADDDGWVGTLSRARPQRYSYSGASLYADDHTKPWNYTYTPRDKSTSFHGSFKAHAEAKQAVIAFLIPKTNPDVGRVGFDYSPDEDAWDVSLDDFEIGQLARKGSTFVFESFRGIDIPTKTFRSQDPSAAQQRAAAHVLEHS